MKTPAAIGLMSTVMLTHLACAPPPPCLDCELGDRRRGDEGEGEANEGEGEANEGEGEAGDVIEAELEAEGIHVLAIAESLDDGAGGVFSLPGSLFITAEVEQPVDPADPGLGVFTQQLLMIHRDIQAPMIAVTTGYGLFGNYPEELTLMLDANQVIFEHRYFNTSTPTSSDWSSLTIENAAHDQHVVIEKLRRIYRGNFVSTGHSKGGMTALFDERFYPDDVDGVVAYVAPISFARTDSRYQEFLVNIGDDLCRQQMSDYTSAAIALIDDVIDRLAVDHPDYNRAELGSYVSYAIGTLPWGYFQFASFYGGCDFGPLPASVDDVLFLYGLDPTGLDFSYADTEAYYYQVENQLGEPDQTWPVGHDVLATFTPDWQQALRTPRSFTNQPEHDGGRAMRDVAAWYANDARDVVFVYGGADPWTGGNYDIDDDDARGIHTFVQPGGDHGASLAALPEFMANVALVEVARFAGRAPDLRRLTNPGAAVLLPRTLGEAIFEAEFAQAQATLPALRR